MHILWLVKTVLPQAAAACGLAGASDVSGSWLTGQLAALRPHGELRLTVACTDARQKASLQGEQDGVSYRILPGADGFAALLQTEQPDLVHIWGTEYPEAAAMQDAAAAANLPVLISIQGVMRDCAAHLCDGVPDAYRHSGGLWHTIDKVIPGELLDNMQANFDVLARKEAAVLGKARYVTGRTGFDRRATADLAPAARYYPCNETLRPLFYTGALWHAREFGRTPVLFLPQGNYPLKNLHTVIRALPAVRQQFPGAHAAHCGLAAAGQRPASAARSSTACSPINSTASGWQCSWAWPMLMHYTGPLDAAAMRQAYLEADVFLLPSSCENSPNSLGEAMLLGMPCVASNAGGGSPICWPPAARGCFTARARTRTPWPAACCRCCTAPDGGTALGQAARARALHTHDAAAQRRRRWWASTKRF